MSASIGFNFNNKIDFINFLDFVRLRSIEDDPELEGFCKSFFEELRKMHENSFDHLYKLYDKKFITNQLNPIYCREIFELAIGGKKAYDRLPIETIDDYTKLQPKDYPFNVMIINDLKEKCLIFAIKKDDSTVQTFEMSPTNTEWQITKNLLSSYKSFRDFSIADNSNFEDGFDLMDLISFCSAREQERQKIKKIISIFVNPSPLDEIVTDYLPL